MFDSVAEDLAPDALDSFDRLRGDCALLKLDDYTVIELRGEDRKGWLQGQATNDLKQLDAGASSAFCLCSPTGQIIAVCDIWGLKDRFILTCQSVAAQAVNDRIEQMVILEDVQSRDVTAEFDLLSIQGPNATAELSEFFALPTLDAADLDGGGIALRSNRTGLGGWDLLLPKGDSAMRGQLNNTFAPVLPEAYEIARLEAGIPLIGKDIDAKTMPPELGPAFEARHVSYNKGCYTGQEVLMRIHSRGHTNKTWVGLRAEKPFEAGNAVSHSRRADAGTVTSACYSPDYGFIGAAMLRNEAVLEGDFVTIASSSGPVSAEVRQMPILRFD